MVHDTVGSAGAYEPFAEPYDRFWGSVSLRWLPLLSVLLLPRLRAGARLLDLCCGSGRLAGELHGLGYAVAGLDGSRSLLSRARDNAPGVDLIQGDARRFALRPVFDAALSVFDSLNHLLSVADLAGAFASVCSCLRPGGLFLFDVNTPRGYELHWRGRRRIVAEGYVIRTSSRFYPERGLGSFRAVIVRGDDTARRVELWQRCHRHDEIVTSLQLAGFNLLATYGLEGDALAQGDLESAERAFYLCRRPLRSGARGATPRGRSMNASVAQRLDK